MGITCHRRRKVSKMMWVLAVIIIAIFLYLGYALINPEKF
ncbi:K(+)-transporting ATPase subunit F [Paenibacillus aquistagni]